MASGVVALALLHDRVTLQALHPSEEAFTLSFFSNSVAVFHLFYRYMFIHMYSQGQEKEEEERKLE